MTIGNFLYWHTHQEQQQCHKYYIAYNINEIFTLRNTINCKGYEYPTPNNKTLATFEFIEDFKGVAF